MTPTSPVLSEEFASNETVYAKDQPQYNPLPSIRKNDGLILTRWVPTPEEREAISAGADIYLSVMTFNQPLQPLRLEVACCQADKMAIAKRMGLID